MTEADPTAVEPDDESVAPEGRKFYVQCQQGDFVMELPSGWRVTFGAVNPGGNSQGMPSRELHCLRVWDGPGKSAMLRAVFCDVRGIRDLAIPFARKMVKETGSAEWHRDDLGNFEQSSKRQIEETIVGEEVEF